MISVLCINPISVYHSIPNLDLWDEQRNAYRFTGSNPVITHAPCAQWSRMKAFSNPDPEQKQLAHFCCDQVERNGGIFEHPQGSSFFKERGIKPTISIDQFWFGFPARKRTWLYFQKCKPIAHPLRFDAIEQRLGARSGPIKEISKRLRACYDNRICNLVNQLYL